MFTIIGLGNPGNEYANTRHNVGFLVADELAKKLSATFSNKRSMQALVAKTEMDGVRVLLIKPQTFMNASGKAVASVVSKHPIKPKELLVIYDDADLPFGDVRFKTAGSSAGHHGIESIQNALGKQTDIARVRIGIGRSPYPDIALEDFVLGTWTSSERSALPEIIKHALVLIEDFVLRGSV
jgi:PTH1 family peptidyl-tRNA hydrolase